MRNSHLFCVLILTASTAFNSTPVIPASFVTEADRPDRQWLTAFDGAKKIKVGDSIEQALSQCPQHEYCELLIDQLIVSKTVELKRSKIRITGVEGNQIRRADHPDANGFFFRIGQGVSHVVFSNLNIDGESRKTVPDIFGIGTYGSAISHVLVSNNRISGLHGSENAHAIAFYGNGATDEAAINNVIIENNQISDMRTGSSESIVVNGNVRQWEIIGNTIRRINNIAIDAIGGEGIAPVGLLPDGRTAPGKLDAARYGFIENNTVNDMSTRNNPAYGNQHSWAAAIYIDGGHSIKVHDNNVANVPWGLVVGSENCTSSSFIQMYENRSSDAYYGDILLGGYSDGGYLDNIDIDCNPHSSHDANEGHGYVSHLDIRGNHLQSNADNSAHFIGNTVLQHRVTQSTVEPPYTRLNE